MLGKIYIECTCIQKKNTGIARTITSLINTLKNSGFEVIELKQDKSMSSIRKFIYYNYELPSMCNKNMSENDIFLIPNNMGKFWRLPCRHTWVLMHDVIPLSKYGQYPLWKKILYKYKTKQIEKAERIITISEYVKKNIIDNFNVAHERIKVLYWSAFNSPHSSANVNCKEPYFVGIGTGEYRKNVEFLIKSWPYVYDNRYKLKLFGKEWKLGIHSELKKMIQNANMQNYIELLGPVSDEEMNKLYTNAYGFIFSSLEEGFGLPPLEALKCGCNIVLPKTPVNYELYGNIGDFYSVGDINELANCIKNVASKSKETESRNTNIAYSDRFSMDVFKIRVNEVFSSSIRV